MRKNDSSLLARVNKTFCKIGFLTHYNVPAILKKQGSPCIFAHDVVKYEHETCFTI